MYRQTMFAEFEMMTHRDIVQEGGVLTAEKLCGIYHKLNKDYFGEQMVSDEEIQYEWAGSRIFTRRFMYTSTRPVLRRQSRSAANTGRRAGYCGKKYKEFFKRRQLHGPDRPPEDMRRGYVLPEPVAAALRVFEEYLGKLEKSSLTK